MYHTSITPTYVQAWHMAIERSRQYKLINDDPPTTTKQLLPKPSALLLQRLIDALGRPSGAQLAGQCLAVSYRLLPHVCAVFGAAFFTVGYLTIGDRPLYFFSENDVQRWLTDGLPQGTANLHAWLTLPSMEILDFTFGPSVALKNNAPDMAGIMIAQHPDTLQIGLRYHPMLVGEAFLERTGALRWMWLSL